MGAVAGGLAYVLAAYGVALALLAGLIIWIVLDHAAQRRALADLDAQGVRRRSQREDDAE